MKRRFHLAALAAAFLVLAALSGCGEAAKVNVKGTLTRGGKPLIVSKKTYVVMKFAPFVPDSELPPLQTYTARFNHETGGYTIELPAGKYSAYCAMLDENSQKIPTGPCRFSS